MFYLDFTTILQLLKEFQRSGVLETELPKGIMNTQEPCRLQCKLLQGELTGYQILAGFGETFVVDEGLLRQIESLGPLEWTFGPQQETTASPMHPAHNPASSAAPTSAVSPSPVPQPFAHFIVLVPRRPANLDQNELNILTRQQRRVLALVDGRRNVGQIATLLFSSSTLESAAAEVLTLLQKLEAQSLVVLR